MKEQIAPPPAPRVSFLDDDRFTVLCEIEPPRRPSLDHLRSQVDAMLEVADAFLIPDNHLGRATVSSLAVAQEVAHMGGCAIPCLNARDRNLLGFRRDLLTAAAYGFDHLLFVHGDAPSAGKRTEELNVRDMIDEARGFGEDAPLKEYPGFKVGTVAKLARPLAWRAAADFVLVQISYTMDQLARWARSLDYAGKIYAGVLVLENARMARRISATIPDIRIPEKVIKGLESDPSYGLQLALEQIEAVRELDQFAGVHLVPVKLFPEMAERLRRSTANRLSG
ncbi:MAG TPA: methylenetetrahydrofolate reductase [Actinomycetota bacterium]|nr:methylenetetrahydrofolate reductase [Actinomycetota bacterium]